MKRDKRGQNRSFSFCNFFPKNRRGISGIVITLIIVLISIAAIILVWVAINSAIKSGSEGIASGISCLNNGIDVKKVTCSDGDANKICDIEFARTGSGKEAIGGVKLVFRNKETGTSSPAAIDIFGNIEPLVGKRQTGIDTGIPNAEGADKVEVTIYFKDDLGKEQLCSQPTPFDFIA